MSKRLIVLAVVALTACGLEPEVSRTREEPLTQCEVTLPEGATRAWAVPDGVVFARGEEVLRAQGHGCALTVDAPVALGTLEAVDDLGRVYVRPTQALREAHFPGVFGDTVARVDARGTVTPIVSAGRGLWSFSVSPGGETVVVTACGPEGVLSVPDLESVLAVPGDLAGSVLTGPSTGWSLAMQNCERGLCAERGLMRSTPQGDTAIATFGSGTFSIRLSRCGDGVCVANGQSLTVFSASGSVVQQLTLSELGAGPEAWLDAVTSNSLGLYLTVFDTTPRVLFVPTGGHAR